MSPFGELPPDTLSFLANLDNLFNPSPDCRDSSEGRDRVDDLPLELYSNRQQR